MGRNGARQHVDMKYALGSSWDKGEVLVWAVITLGDVGYEEALKLSPKVGLSLAVSTGFGAVPPASEGSCLGTVSWLTQGSGHLLGLPGTLAQDTKATSLRVCKVNYVVCRGKGGAAEKLPD